MAFISHFFIFSLWLVQLKCESYENRAKIKSINGNLILKPAYGKNVHIIGNGPESKVYIGDVNILGFNTTLQTDPYRLNEQIPITNIKIPQEILQKIDQLEKITSSLSNNFLFNVTYLMRRINTLNNKVRLLQSRINNRDNDECQSHPCENGGTCLNLVNGYHCLCLSAWKGRNCDEDVNECRIYAGTDLGCQNGATCINRPGSYECLCKPGWYGLDCTRKAKDCSGGDFEMCGHGTCIPVTTGEGIKCICNQGWSTNGTHVACLTDVNECETGQGARCSVNPRVECINLPGTFKCGQCPPGYEGDGFTCYDIDECLTIPNGGCSTSPMVTCHNTIGSRICGPCPPGYQGDGVTCTWRGSCSINHGGCHPSAQCMEMSVLGSQVAQCVCPYGMAGDGIGIHGCYVPVLDNSTQTCENNPCGIHGRCHATRQGYTCICYQGYSGMHCQKYNDFCSNNPCLNGGTCRLEENASRGFRCECTALYSGHLCELRSQPCGGVLDAEEGSITYPISNSSYINNARCAWVIHTVPDKVINVTFSKFNLEYHSQCHYDFVQIHDGRSSASQLIGRFCGNKFPNGGNIISSHNNLYFWFRSDSSVAKTGFALHWTSIPPKCGGELDATTHGHISSPGSPGNYPSNRDCYWHLKTTLGKRIQLHFYQLDIQVHVNCSYDFIAIYDGAQTLDPLISKYCNSTQPAPLESTGSELLIHFHSDENDSGKGFQISYAPIEGVPGCGGLFTSNKGEIFSPSYNGSYLNNLLCEYKIKTRPETKIRVKFIYFDIERSLRCRYDYLKIYDGDSSNSRLIGKFCGKTAPTSFVSMSNSLYIIFKSDHTMGSGGFKFIYESICHQTISGDSGIIKSPGYPMAYPKQTVCEYVISTNPGKAIQLTFQDFDIEDNRYYNCEYDHVEIRDGPTSNSTLMGRFCGSSDFTPPVQISSYNYMYVKFNSDMSITASGFYANYTTIDIECGGIYRESNGIINHPLSSDSQYKNDQSCTWMVIAPEGMYIQLAWNRFELEDMTHCNSDYVQLIELIEASNDNNTLGKYCGNSLPPQITVSSNIIMIKFISDSSIPDSGFSLSYTFLDEKSHCGGTYVKTHGLIHTPGWPERYEANRDCTWTISVPEGQRVSLNISDFDLERPIRDKCELGDLLEIRDGSSQNSPLIGKYCGSFKTKSIISTSNHIYLHFHSDFYLSGKGFKIEWDGTLRGCGGTLTGYSGSISSPNYPQNYGENAVCFYKIVTSGGSKIQISFTDLDLEQTSNCLDDYVEIFDGQNSNSPSFGKYCNISSSLSNILTTSNYAFIKFKSDFIFSRKGFLLNYNTVCNNNISGSYGVIESPGYPDKYPLNSNCLWTITVPKGNIINITFTDFNMFDTYFRPYGLFRTKRSFFRSNPNFNAYRLQKYVSHCEFDYVQFKETSAANFSAKHCGSTLPRPINTKTNSLQIKFVSNNFHPQKGFRLEWFKHGCGNHIQRPSGSLSFNEIKQNDDEVECEWLLETPVGTSVTLTISEFYIKESINCSVDSIEIYNGQSKSFPLLTKVCHREKIKVQATSNFMFVRLVKRSSLRDIFMVSHFDSLQLGCGGVIESQSGLIHSKNYPKNYENNLDCIWYISVPNNHRIELDFVEIDLFSEYENDDCNDCLKIYDGNKIFNSNYSYLICPKTNVTSFVSQHSSLAIQFSTNNLGTAKGFVVNFTMICGAVIEAEYDGIISNNNYINSKNRNCTWTILASNLNKKIKLTIQHLDLPREDILTNKNCPSSFLKVYDGDDDQSPLIDEFCGKKVPPMIVSHGNALTIKFGTYTNSNNGVFSAHYTTLSTACGGQLTSEEGTIASPNYPLSYPINIDCEWTLKTSPGNRVYITFDTFDLNESEGCNEDYLEVRENDGGGNLLALYCGHDVPINTTTASKLYIKFHSNNVKTGQGFLLHYGFLHGNDIIGLHSGEIASPLYPYPYRNEGIYTWRITIKGSKNIVININMLEIPKYSEVCNNKLIIYDGYDEDAPVLEELCGILRSNEKTITTSSTVAFIKLVLDETNTGTQFYLKWTEIDRNIDQSYPDSKINCGSNITRLVTGDNDIVITSPKYPNSYEPNLNCEWIFKSNPGNHLTLQFRELVLEETSNCYADYISVYSSYSPTQWTPLKENMCLSLNGSEKFEASTYIKINFITDQSLNSKGFRAVISSVCGGFLYDESGVIENRNIKPLNFQATCDWIIKVRPGRTIKLKFELFNITNDNICNTYVILRNGGSNDSPFLGDGKYCGYAHENRSEVISSSNYMFIRYLPKQRYPNLSQYFRLRYEEQNIECGITALLDNEHKWEVISSPNYPFIPNAFTECVWIFTGPPGEILRIDFIDRFDLDSTQNCNSESVEVRDGSTGMSPLKGIFCKQRPSTTKSTSNTIFVKYSTQIPDPRNGFKANISIDVCGATINSASGDIESPNYPDLMVQPPGTICEWHIISTPGHVIKIIFKDIDLPESEKPCETKITITDPTSDIEAGIGTLNEFCHSDLYDLSVPIETMTNKVIIKLHFGKPDTYTQLVEKRGFKLSFSSSRPFCGGLITTSEGYITSPGYPRLTSQRYCQWSIVLPNENRRVRLEIEDANSNIQFSAFNDMTFNSKIEEPINITNSPKFPRIFESTGNKLAFYIWFQPNLNTMNRFKAKFSSNSPALCGGRLRGIEGELESPNISRSYTCEWQYTRNTIRNNTIIEYNTLYITLEVTTSQSRKFCRHTDSVVILQSQIHTTSFTRKLCGNSTHLSYRIPSSSNLKIKAVQHTLPLLFNIKWKLQPCGGVIHVNNKDPINILSLPDSYDESIECGWILLSENGIRIELKLEGTFNLECSEEYILINHGASQMSSTIGNYCKDRIPDKPLILSYMYTYIQYHSRAQIHRGIKLLARANSIECGGLLNRFERSFSSPNYPHNYQENQECTWEIQTDLGYRVSLQFVERFVIEDKPNCTKDAVIIYDWKDNAFIEIARLCGRNRPPLYNSTYNQMKVVFRSDNNINLDGFKAQWSPICGGNFVATENDQFLYSPGYNFDYYSSLHCHYEIFAPSKKIIVTFLSFELEGPIPDCKYDNLTIYFESDNNFYMHEIFCGNEIPRPVIAYESVKIDFNTDKYGQKRGFKLLYTTYNCGGEVKDPTAITLDNISDNMNCTWLIEAPTNKQVILKFDYIDVESSFNCYSDYIAIFEGPSINPDKRLALICGRVNSTSIKSKGNKMILQFITDTNFLSKGFTVKINFSYSELVGCGGEIILNSSDSHVLKSPLLGSAIVYENFLDCHWSIKAPTDHIIKVEFTSFHIAPCLNVNQTALGFTKCDCDFVMLKDGLNPNSLIIGKYCGHNFPPQLTSSGNLMSIVLTTDGDITSSGFEATLSTTPSTCGQSVYVISKIPQHITSPGYKTGTIPRGLHCSYYLDSSSDLYSMIHISVKYLDLQPGTRDQCDQDKLVLYSNTKSQNSTMGKDFIWNGDENDLIHYAHIYDSSLIFPKTFILCGRKSSLDFYLTGSIKINLLTSPEATSAYKGVDIEVSYVGFCSRNYTEPQGRIQNAYETVTTSDIKDCYILITAPENFTISVYFMSVTPTYWNEKVYLEIFDGNVTNAPLLLKIAKEYEENYALFSSGRYMLFHNHIINSELVTVDLNYITNDKGKGCGGKLYNELGRITSPLYPETYRKKTTCEWELETPTGTYLRLHFTVFDLGKLCDQNYVSLINRNGDTITTYCLEMPADYTSVDNYVKIAFTTTMNNGGTGWVADFVGTM